MLPFLELLATLLANVSVGEEEGVFINPVGRRSCVLNPRLGLGWRFPLQGSAIYLDRDDVRSL